MNITPARSPRLLLLACLVALSTAACDRRDAPPPNADTGASSSSPDTASTVIPETPPATAPQATPPVDCTGLTGQALDDCRIRAAVSPPPVAAPATVPRDGVDPEQNVDAPMTNPPPKEPPVDETTPP